jgi:hypothetical protein
MLIIAKQFTHHAKPPVGIINENEILVYLFAEAGSWSTLGWYDTRVLPHASKEELALPAGALTLISALLDATICCVVYTTSSYLLYQYYSV